VNIAKLQSDVDWLKKGMSGLALIGLAAVGWIFYNIYQPVQTLVKDSAVQTSILSGMKEDISAIKTTVQTQNDDTQGSPREGQTQSVHQRTQGRPQGQP
jgi:hypothetical protein